MNDDAERYVRWYAHLEPDAPLDRHAARVLLRRALADREALADYLLNVECAPALLGEPALARCVCRRFGAARLGGDAATEARC